MLSTIALCAIKYIYRTVGTFLSFARTFGKHSEYSVSNVCICMNKCLLRMCFFMSMFLIFVVVVVVVAFIFVKVALFALNC